MAHQQGAAPAAASSSTTSSSFPSSSLPPLPPGWTENKAPTGHTYYYNAQTKESTYRRPPPPPPPPPPSLHALPTHLPQPFSSQPAPFTHGPQAPAPFLRLSDPRVANAFMAQQNAAANPQQHGSGGRGGFGGRGGRGGRGRGGDRGGGGEHPRHQPTDKPRSCIPIPGHEPWVLVYTKLGRRFVHNTEKNTSFWRIPEKLMPAILELDKAGIQQKVEAAMKEGKIVKDAKDAKKDEAKPSEAGRSAQPVPDDDLGSDYEEVEVTDDEDEGGPGDDSNDGEGSRRKRQRTEDVEGADYDYGMADREASRGGGAGGGPVEFGEDDIAFQLAAAAAAYGDDGDGYNEGEDELDGEGGQDGEGEEGNEEEEDGKDHDGPALFRALLDDFQINPFSPWEKLIEEGKVFDDPRYTALPNMKARRDVWEAWSRDAIRARKEAKERALAAAAEAEKQTPRDPRAAYLQLLQDHATPKLYWPEFKRKFRKEAALKDSAAPHKEKDKEKLYRDYVARRKLPASTRKADLSKLLASLPRALLNSQTLPTSLPIELTGDLRYVAMEPQTRDELVEAFLKTAGPP
ncbi:hypothetical protein SCUCBS95973_007079 [Sporothrix curviconia]|uniref:WW domain-containing protein n=1 Tax=Sporothrix curviconia TaxID=1260050 RepID=A0ABP0CAG1_9PEZI